ncbi:F-box protein [Melia azedarach]|uniref:F-box protein n=1 Tax=Melia azedarach TaxID=155640 RepID=A0ACC1X4C2_MELAZ|nr:F-box protein [Melia azedarach]
MSRVSSVNLPPWEVLNLVAHHLDPKTLAIASCVSKSWFVSLSSDYHWQPICAAHYPRLANLKVTDPAVTYHRLFAVGHTASKRRLKPPPTPCISLDDLLFAVDIRTKDAPYLTVAKLANELYADPNGVFRFDIDVNHERFGLIELQEELKITWTVVLRGWEGVFTMMGCGGRLSLSPATTEGWFSQELPSPRCCSSEVANGIVADLKLGFCSRRESTGDQRARIKKVSVGILSIFNWRYVNVDDGLRYLQHFLLPNSNP